MQILMLWLGCPKTAPPEASEVPDLAAVDLLSLVPELSPGRPGYYRFREQDWTPLAWRAHREVLALEESDPPERATADELVLRFHLHALAAELSENPSGGFVPFYDVLDDQPVSLHRLRDAQLLRAVPSLGQSELEPRFLEALERYLGLVDAGEPFSDADLVLERLHQPYEGPYDIGAP